MSDETAGKLKVERSPRAPSLPLRIALVRAKSLYDLARGHPAPITEALKQWGYGPKSSGGLQTVATLKMYGLADDIGSGAERKIQLTREAIEYLIDERPDRRMSARRLFALRPKILRSLWNMWKADPPSPPIARSLLRLEHGFTEKAANDLIKIYQENFQFAGLSGEAEEDEAIEEPAADTDATADVSIGDYVQWESDGQLQFKRPERVTWISDDGSHLRVEGSQTGIPVSEVRKVDVRPARGWASASKYVFPLLSNEGAQPYQITLTEDGLQVVASVDKAGLKRLIRVLQAQLALLEERDAVDDTEPGTEE